MVFSALLLHVIASALLLRPTSSYKPLPPKNTNNRDATSNGSAELQGRIYRPKESNGTLSHKSHSTGDITLSKSSSFTTSLTKDRRGSLQLEEQTLEHDPEHLCRTNSLYLAPYQILPGDEEDHSPVDKPVSVSKSPHWINIACYFCKLYDWGLFRNKRFLIYALGMCTGHMGYICTCLFLPSFAHEKGVPPYNVALLMSITGAADLIGRILGGWFGDLKLIKRNVLSGSCLVFTGIFALFVPLIPYYPVMVAFCIVLGAIGGTYVALMLSVVIDLVGLAKVSPAFSLALMGSGITAIPTPILLGIYHLFLFIYNLQSYIF